MRTRAETIAAIATARGPAALGIVRISGPDAGRIVDLVVPGPRPSTRPRKVVAGIARDPSSGEPIDEVVAFYSPGPGTATGEDTAEIQGHGGAVVLNRILGAAKAAGAASAGPGEFTYRAFLNGRIDLTQAEAVMRLIGARSDRAADAALRHLTGSLGRTLSALFERVVSVSAQLEAGLDFPEEDITPDSNRVVLTELGQILSELERLRDSFDLGSILARGARVAIAGPPNAGKSSLLNRLAASERAIVDPDPGTTRDTLEADCEVDGVPVAFVDTAGLREGGERVERLGMERTREVIVAADVVIAVVDGTNIDELEATSQLVSGVKKLIVAVNKNDLSSWRDPEELPASMERAPRFSTSALTGDGTDELLSAVGKIIGAAEGDDAEMLASVRQRDAVAACIDHILRASDVVERGADPELAADDLRLARESLAEITGSAATEELLETIFARFCVGK